MSAIRHNESRSQQAVCQWWAYAWKSFGLPCEECLFAIPNGGSRRVVEAVIMKREGVRKGVSDLFLSVPRGISCGLYIEMKTPDGRIRPEQTKFQEAMMRLGYASMVCRSAEEAIERITTYLKDGD
jgi:hypothetical protein